MTIEYEHDSHTHEAMLWMLAVLVKRAGGSVKFTEEDDVEGYMMYTIGHDLATGMVLRVVPESQIGRA